MSYILEALKKAQAERQLGNAPTIHAPTLHAAPTHVPVVKKTSVLALGIGLVVLAGAGWFIWSQRTPAPGVVLTAPPVVAAAPVATPTPVAAVPAPVVAPTAVVAPAPVAPAPAVVASAPVTPAPAVVASAPVAPAPAVVVPATVTPAPVVVQAEPVVRPRKAAAVAPLPAPAVAASAPAPAAPEDNLRYARDLPQEIQQQLPHVAFGGYMYSDYAADRLVLVDKTLRHEGEEIAPGLMLEKLLPRGAVLNFRGTRYRVNF